MRDIGLERRQAGEHIPPCRRSRADRGSRWRSSVSDRRRVAGHLRDRRADRGIVGDGDRIDLDVVQQVEAGGDVRRRVADSEAAGDRVVQRSRRRRYCATVAIFGNATTFVPPVTAWVTKAKPELLPDNRRVLMVVAPFLTTT